MRNGWEAKKLGEVIKLEYGKPLPYSKRKLNGAYPVYGANGEKDRTDEYYYDKQSIIVGRKGSAGETNLTESKFWPLDVTYFVTFDEKQYDLSFIYYLLGTHELPKLAKGVKPGINRNEVYAISTLIPPLPTQQRIVTILDEAFNTIAIAKENAERNLQNARELFESYLQSVFANPGNGWDFCKIEDYIKFIDYRGRTPKKTSDGLRLITAKNVKNGFIQKDPEEFVNPAIYNSWMTRGIPKLGDILFTTEAPLANVAQLNTNEKVVFAQRIIILQPQPNKIDQTFLKYMLLSKPIKQKILTNGTGATVQGIKASRLKEIAIYFPESIPEQQAIVAKLDTLSTETKKLEAIYKKKLADLDELKKSILHKAFEGELTSL